MDAVDGGGGKPGRPSLGLRGEYAPRAALACVVHVDQELTPRQRDAMLAVAEAFGWPPHRVARALMRELSLERRSRLR